MGFGLPGEHSNLLTREMRELSRRVALADVRFFWVGLDASAENLALAEAEGVAVVKASGALPVAAMVAWGFDPAAGREGFLRWFTLVRVVVKQSAWELSSHPQSLSCMSTRVRPS